MGGILEEEVADEHEVLRNSSTRLGSHRGRERVRLEPLIEIVLPQKGLEHILFRIVVLLSDHRLPSHFLLLLLVFVDPNGDVALLLSILTFLRPVTLPILLSILAALLLRR